MKRVVVNMSTSRKERFKLYKAKKRWLIAGLAFAGAAMMTGGQVSADQVSETQVGSVKTAVSTQPDPSVANGAVVTATSATLTTEATAGNVKQDVVEPASTPSPATDTTTTTPVAQTAEVSTNQDATADATVQAPTQPVATPATDTAQGNAQKATTTENVAHTWDYANDTDVQATVDATINGAVNSNGEIIKNGGDFTQADTWSTARVDNGYAVTVTIDNTTGKYKNGDTIQIPIAGEMSSDVATVAKQKFNVRETQGTLMNGESALGTYTIADGYFSIKLTQDLFGISTSNLTISGTNGSAPVANSAIWMNKTGSATITFGNSTIKGTLAFKVQPKLTNTASATQKLNTESDKVGVQSSFQDNNYLGTLYSGDTEGAKNDEAGLYNKDLVQIQHIVINNGIVRSVSAGRSYTSLYVPMTDDNGNIVASAVSAADVTLNVGKEIQVQLDSNGGDLVAMESAIAKSLKNKGVGSYAIVQRKDGSYVVAYNIGNPYKDYSATDVLNGVDFTKFLADGNNQGLLTDAQVAQLKTNISKASAGKNSVGIGAIAHIFNFNFASNDTQNEVTSTLDTYDVDGNSLANWGDKNAKTTPDTQDFNGQARLSVSYVDENSNDLAPIILTLRNSGDAYTTDQKTFPGYTLKTIHGNASGKYGLANETTPVVYIYTADRQVVNYNVIDDTDNKILVSDKLFDEGVTAGKLSKTKVDLQAIANEYVNQGYDIKLVEDVPATFDNDDKTAQVVNIHLKHRMTTVTPDKPEKPGQPVMPSKPEGPKWPTENDLNKTVNETINYVYEDDAKAAEPAKDKVSFRRTAIVDEVTGEITYGDWVAKDNDAMFDAVKSPIIAGYEPNPAQIDAITVTANMGDVENKVTYKAEKQHATISYVDEVTGETLSVDQIEGVSNAKSGYTTATKIADYVNKGYKFDSSDFPADGLTFDTDTEKSQDYTVKFTHETTTTDTPENPGSPIDPKNPNGPKWSDGVSEMDLKKTVKETVHYVFSDNSVAAPDVTDSVEFTRTATVDEVTGKVIAYGEWTATHGDTTFDAKVSPVITGYFADKANIAEVDNLTPASANMEETVTYRKLGSYVPELPDGSTPSVPYPNDPTNPTKPGTDVPAMPYVPGYTPEGPDGKPLTPVDPENPSKGYNPPTVPDDPTTDTVIKYDGDEQKVVYNVIDDTTGKKLEDGVAFDSGKTKSALNKSQSDLEAIADAYAKRGYEIVSVDPVPGAFDNDDTADQVVNIHVKHVTTTVTPENPGMPGSPIDPSNPDGPKWPAGTDKNSVDAVVKETVHYVYKDGSKAADDASDAVEFTRTATVDEATGEVTYTDWVAKNGDATFDAKVSPVITGYTPSDAQIDAIPVTAEMGDVSRKVTYKADEQKAVVNFVDQDTGTILKTQLLHGVTNSHETYTPAKDVAYFESVVYDLVSNDFPDDGFQYDSDDTNVQEFTVVLKHKVVTAVVPNKPQEEVTRTGVVPNEPQPEVSQSAVVPNEPQPEVSQSAVVPNEPQPEVSQSAVVPNEPQPEVSQSAVVPNEPQPEVSQSAVVPNEPQPEVSQSAVVPNEPQPEVSQSAVVPNEPQPEVSQSAVVPNEPQPKVSRSEVVPNEPQAEVSHSEVVPNDSIQVLDNEGTTHAQGANQHVATTATVNEGTEFISNAVILPETAAKGDQDKSALLVALAVMASFVTFAFVPKRK